MWRGLRPGPWPAAPASPPPRPHQMKSVQWLQKVGCLKKRAVNLWLLTSCTTFCLKAPFLQNRGRGPPSESPPPGPRPAMAPGTPRGPGACLAGGTGGRAGSRRLGKAEEPRGDPEEGRRGARRLGERACGAPAGSGRAGRGARGRGARSRRHGGGGGSLGSGTCRNVGAPGWGRRCHDDRGAGFRLKGVPLPPRRTHVPTPSPGSPTNTRARPPPPPAGGWLEGGASSERCLPAPTPICRPAPLKRLLAPGTPAPLGSRCLSDCGTRVPCPNFALSGRAPSQQRTGKLGVSDATPKSLDSCLGAS